MRVGIFVSETWGPGSTIDEIRERAVRAEALGYPSAWVPYLPWATDALMAMQAAGTATERIEVGSAVIPTFFFHPLAMARQAATVQSAIGRPVHLGIGCSNPAIVAMHGLPFERPARHVQRRRARVQRRRVLLLFAAQLLVVRFLEVVAQVAVPKRFRLAHRALLAPALPLAARARRADQLVREPACARLRPVAVVAEVAERVLLVEAPIHRCHRAFGRAGARRSLRPAKA